MSIREDSRLCIRWVSGQFTYPYCTMDDAVHEMRCVAALHESSPYARVKEDSCRAWAQEARKYGLSWAHSYELAKTHGLAITKLYCMHDTFHPQQVESDTGADA